MILVKRSVTLVNALFVAQLIVLFVSQHLFERKMYAVERSVEASLSKGGMAAEQVNAITQATSLMESHISTFVLSLGIFLILTNLATSIAVTKVVDRQSSQT
jgi:hypothetical protein